MIAGRAQIGLLLSTVLTVLGVAFSTPQLARQTNFVCTSDQDCEIPHTECFNKSRCLCKSDYIAKNVNKTSFDCLLRAQVLDDPCVDDMQCEVAFGKHSACLSGKCQCRSNAHYVRGLCFLNLKIGELCRVTNDCYVESTDIISYCDVDRCVCPPGYRANAKRTDCIRVVGIGGPCMIDDDCSVMNSRCLRECVCQLGYVEDEKGQHCLPVANELGQPCIESSQCAENLRNAYCDSSTQECVCESGTHVKNGRCLKTAKLHEPCIERDECVITSRNDTAVNCIGGFCRCSESFERKGDDCVKSEKAILPSRGEKLVKPLAPLFMLLAAIVFLTVNY